MASADPEPLQRFITDYSAGGAIKPEARWRFYAALAPVVFKYASRAGNTLDSALMVISQARAEQGFTGPFSQGYRVFNTQLTTNQMNILIECKKKQADQVDACIGSRIPELNDPEVWYAWVDSKEYDTNGKPVMRKSPFFIFNTLDASVRFFYERLAGKYTLAATALTAVSNGTGNVVRYGNALDHVKYSTNSHYGGEVVKLYKETVPDFKTILSNEISSKKATGAAPENLQALQDCLDSLPSDAAVMQASIAYAPPKQSQGAAASNALR